MLMISYSIIEILLGYRKRYETIKNNDILIYSKSNKILDIKNTIYNNINYLNENFFIDFIIRWVTYKKVQWKEVRYRWDINREEKDLGGRYVIQKY